MNTKHLKAKILDLAIRGKLVLQDPSEGNAADLLKEHNNIPEDEIPFEIPENWCWCNGKEIFSQMTSKKPEGEEFKYIDIESVDNKLQKIHHPKIMKTSNAPSRASRETRIGDVVFSMVRPYLKNIARISENLENCIASTGFFVCRPKEFIDSKYCYYLMISSYVVNGLNQFMKGDNSPSINSDDITDFLYPIPPLSEQQRIVSAIEKAFEQIDIIEKNKQNLKTYIKQTKSKVLDLAIHGKLVEQNQKEGNAFELLEKIRKEKSELIKQKKLKEDKKSSFIIKAEDGKHYEQFADGTLKDIEDEIPFEIPENWCWCRLREIGNWQSGCTPDKSRKDFYDKADIPWLNSGDLTDSYIETIPHYVSQIAFDEKRMKLNEAGSVCIAMYGATIGKLGILTKPATTNQAVLVCSKLHLSDSKYLFYFLKSHKKEYIQAGFGGAQPNISKEKVEPTLFPLPPLDEQKRIVERIEQIFEQLDILEKSLGD